jgi:hypothetical protein
VWLNSRCPGVPFDLCGRSRRASRSGSWGLRPVLASGRHADEHFNPDFGVALFCTTVNFAWWVVISLAWWVLTGRKPWWSAMRFQTSP